MTFLTVYTPTYRRPQMLEQCRESVAAQTVQVEHVIVEDNLGLGVDGMFADIRNHAHKATGDYVMVLSDDNVLADDQAVAELEDETRGNGYPDVIVFKGQCGPSLQPLVWGEEPQITRIDLSNFAVTNQIWQRHKADWGIRYEGDFDFIHNLWERRYRFHWWDRLVYRALRISAGAPE